MSQVSIGNLLPDWIGTVKGKGQTVHSKQPKDSLAMPRQEGCGQRRGRHNTSSPSWIQILRGGVQQKRGSQSYPTLLNGWANQFPYRGPPFFVCKGWNCFFPGKLWGLKVAWRSHSFGSMTGQRVWLLFRAELGQGRGAINIFQSPGGGVYVCRVNTFFEVCKGQRFASCLLQTKTVWFSPSLLVVSFLPTSNK